MNAKSLSTILHLKNLTEKLNQGKTSLEQQLKSAGQLSLAARLAINAKDRVTEEITKEKEVGAGIALPVALLVVICRHFLCLLG